MGYVFDFKDSIEYEKQLNQEQNQIITELETKLLVDMIRPVPGATLLDIGCGTGASSIPFIEYGIKLTGLDPSPYMIDIIARKLQNKIDLHKGFAEDLPFEDNSFNYACISKTLEFTEDHKKALEEAFRVAKDKVFIGVFNKFALKSMQRRISGIFSANIYNKARFFSICELKSDIKEIIGDVPIMWRTVEQLPCVSGTIAQIIGRSKIIQYSPFGTFIGMLVIPVPRFTVRPLMLKYKSTQRADAMTGYASNINYK